MRQRVRTQMATRQQQNDAAALSVVSAPPQRAIGNQAMLRRKCDCADEETEERKSVRRTAAPSAGAPAAVPPIVGEVLRSPGAPLDAGVRQAMQGGFAQDLGAVRVHTDTKAAESARAVDARAYTVGRHVVFGAEQYAPTTEPGSRLLRHELAHVAQAGASAYADGTALELGRRDDPAEREADRVAAGVDRQPGVAARMDERFEPATLRRDNPAPPVLPVKAKSASISFTIPANVDFGDGVSTRAPTSVTVGMTKTQLYINFSPPLLIHNTVVSDMGVHGVTYDFSKPDLDIRPDVYYESSGTLTVGIGTANKKLSDWMRDKVTGTKTAIRPYDPEADPDAPGTLNEIIANLKAGSPGGAAGATVEDKDITGLRARATVEFQAPVTRQQPGGAGVSIPAGTSATITFNFAGTYADNADPAQRKVSSVRVTSDKIILRKDNEDQAAVTELSVAYGGAVTVPGLKLLGSARTAGAVESLLRLFAGLSTDPYFMAAVNSGLLTERMVAGLQPDVVKGMARSEIEKALTPAITQLVQGNCNAVPGMDLCKMLGIKPP